MKILQVINSLGIGGAEKLVSDLVPMFSKESQCDVLILRKTDSTGNEELSLVHELREKGIKVLILTEKKLYHIKHIFEMIKLFKSYDVVHSHLFPSQLWVYLASRLINKKRRPYLITTEHSTSNRRRFNPILRQVDRMMYLGYDRIISISEKSSDSLKKYCGFDSQKHNNKFITITNGVDLKSFISKNISSKSFFNDKFNTSDIVITQVAGFREAKDQDCLIRALTLLPENYYVVFAGDGVRLNRCKDLACKLNLQSRCLFLGKVKDIPSLLKSSTLVVVSSHWEGFGLAAIEGMAAGKPVLASNVPGLAEVVGDSGVLFTKSNYTQLANKIRLLVDNNNIYNQYVYKSQQRAIQFSIEKMAYSYMTLYEEILNTNENNINI